MSTLQLSKIPSQVGYLSLNLNGVVVESSGELENGEAFAKKLYNIVLQVKKVDKNFKRFSINYTDHTYVILIDSKRIQVIRKNNSLIADEDEDIDDPDEEEELDLLCSRQNSIEKIPLDHDTESEEDIAK